MNLFTFYLYVCMFLFMTTTRGHEYLSIIIEKMCDHNPLQIPSAPVPSIGNRNTKGRPRKSQSITFSTQPQSIVSRLLQQMLTENKINLPIEWKSGTNTTPILPIVEDTDHDQYSTAIEEADQIKYENPKKEFSKRKTEMVPKVYLCDYSNCLYTTKLSSNLQKHKRTHTGEKPYLCDKCSFRTSFSNSLKVHKRLHTTERPYPCGHCNYRCNSISNLKKHNLIKHKEKIYK